MTAYLKVRIGRLFDMAKDVAKRPRNDASICIPFRPSRYGKGLSRAGLAISEDGSVIALKAIFYHVFHHVRENCLLLRDHIEDAIKLKLEVVLLDFVVPKAVPLKVEFYLSFLG